MMLRQYLKPHIAAMTIATILALVLGAVSALVYGLIGPAFQILSVNDPQVRLSMTTLIGPTLGAFISRLSGVNDIDAAFLWSKLPIGLIGLSAVRAILGAAQWFIWSA